MDKSEFWKRKLMAFLHDPPIKPYSLQEHLEIAKSLIQQAGLSQELANRSMLKQADRMAACADRAVFPRPGKLSVDWSATQRFRHPLGGGAFTITQPITSPEDAEDKVAQAQHSLGEDADYQRRFYTLGNK